ncbi:MAG: LytR C-terminal domain-containing protein [Actinomycetota bacterium]|nr:LytR C-terminal domain-containing protein [Actinomycetota bacterium]
MGRHSAGNQWAFYRSVTRWVLPWVLIAALIGAGLWFVGRREADTVTAGPSSATSPTPDESVSPASSPSPTSGPSPSGGTEDGGTEEDEGGQVRPLITDDVTVQVLDSIGSDDAQDRMVDRLVALDFAVPFVAEASTTYRSTTVFWSYPEAEAAAKRLAERFGWEADPRPGNLSSGVTIHVVVGRDEAVG